MGLGSETCAGARKKYMKKYFSVKNGIVLQLQKEPPKGLSQVRLRRAIAERVPRHPPPQAKRARRLPALPHLLPPGGG